MEFDVNDMRQIMIDTFQLRWADGKFTFYYDETNNIRKFYLTDHGTNVAEHTCLRTNLFGQWINLAAQQVAGAVAVEAISTTSIGVALFSFHPDWPPLLKR